MRKWKSQYWYNENASAFHEKFRQLLITDSRFRHLRCYQEVNVRDLIPWYEYTNHHFDWYVQELDLVIELHGNQHYKPTNYGNISAEDLLVNFRNSQFRDNSKATAAKTEKLTYIVIPYSLRNKLSYELVISLMDEPNEEQ